MTAPLRIAELADILHARANPWKLMALLRAYFDESGTHSGAKVTGVAGFIGPAEEWDALQAEWEGELRRFARDSGFNILDFHAYDCVNGQSFWFGMDISIREAYYDKLARVVCKYNGIQGVSIAVETDDWDIIATPEFKSRYQSPYGLCAEHCFQQLVSHSKNRAEGTPIAIVLAEHPIYTNNIREIFSHYMSNKIWANVNTLAFASPKNCPPLQCADMISYESYRFWDGFEGKKYDLTQDRLAYVRLANAGHFKLSACYGGPADPNCIAA